MSEKTVYICDGCKKTIEQNPIGVYRQDGVDKYVNDIEPYTTSKGIHLCDSCLRILHNLTQAGCEIEF